MIYGVDFGLFFLLICSEESGRLRFRFIDKIIEV